MLFSPIFQTIELFQYFVSIFVNGLVTNNNELLYIFSDSVLLLKGDEKSCICMFNVSRKLTKH